MTDVVTVFGGTGFLGRRIVRSLLARGATVRVAARHPDRALFPQASDRLQWVIADVTDEVSVQAAVEGATAVANAVALYVERDGITFTAVHLDGARRVAEAARRQSARLLHLSGIGSDADATSPYVRARGRGENAVRAACNGATVFRPCVMIGAGDAFLTTLTGLVRRLPVFPLFGDGSTRLQPVFVGDVAEAAATALVGADQRPGIHELGGPAVRTYRELVELVMHHCGRRRVLLPVPFLVWDGLAAASSRPAGAAADRGPSGADEARQHRRSGPPRPERPGRCSHGGRGHPAPRLSRLLIAQKTAGGRAGGSAPIWAGEKHGARR